MRMWRFGCWALTTSPPTARLGTFVRCTCWSSPICLSWSLRLAREMGWVKLGAIAVDGTKRKANASRHKAMSYARMQAAEVELKAQITALVKKAVYIDEAERDESDLDIPAEIEPRQARLEAIVAAKALAKARDAQRYSHTVAMGAKFETEQGKIDYRKRKWIAEPPNGWIKNVLGFRQFSMRGLKKAQVEFKLVCMALNLRRMGAMQAC